MEGHEWVELEEANAKSWWEDRDQAAGVDIKLFSPLFTFIPLQRDTFVDNKASCGFPAGDFFLPPLVQYIQRFIQEEPTFISLRNASVYIYIYFFFTVNTVDLQISNPGAASVPHNRRWKHDNITLPNHRRQQTIAAIHRGWEQSWVSCDEPKQTRGKQLKKHRQGVWWLWRACSNRSDTEPEVWDGFFVLQAVQLSCSGNVMCYCLGLLGRKPAIPGAGA